MFTAFLLPLTASAQVRTWDGDTSDIWGTPGNWIGDNVPDTVGEGSLFSGIGTGDIDLNGVHYTNGSLAVTVGNYRIIFLRTLLILIFSHICLPEPSNISNQ